MDNGELGSYASYGTYTIPSETGFKQYYIKGEYTDEHFGNGKVIAPIEGTSGNDRFYVMALEDSVSSYVFWWKNAYGHLDTTYSISSTTQDFAVAGAEPTGLVNTRRMGECYKNEEINGVEVLQDGMWGLVQDEVAKGWFVPSKSEWAVFGVAFDITSSNYSNIYGLNYYYWTSSQASMWNVYRINFISDVISSYNLEIYYGYVRLATTF